MSEKSTLRCPLYGEHPCEDCIITVSCNNGGTTEFTLAEARARFMQRPESAWEMRDRLVQKYGYLAFLEKLGKQYGSYNRIASEEWLQTLKEQEAISIMQQIEKELKDKS